MNHDEMRKVAEAATKGPWYAIKNPEWGGSNYRIDTRPDAPWGNFGQIAYTSKANAHHIATFDPPTVLALLDDLSRLRHERDEAVARFKKLRRAYRDRVSEREYLRACFEDRDTEMMKAVQRCERLEKIIYSLLPPSHGEYGGPLVRMVAQYEDGSPGKAITPVTTKMYISSTAVEQARAALKETDDGDA
jgi:uncharacterized protein YlbG (UPF0298 family)